jgi:hypothetical protein
MKTGFRVIKLVGFFSMLQDELEVFEDSDRLSIIFLRGPEKNKSNPQLDK